MKKDNAELETTEKTTVLKGKHQKKDNSEQETFETRQF